MKSTLKWSAIVIGCLAVIIIAALLIIPMFVDVQKYKPVLESKVEEATGRPFTVGDDLKLSLFPWAGVSFSNLQLGNPAGFAEKEFVKVKSFEVRVKLLPLISKEIQIKRFVMDEPQIVLVKNKNGRGNWEQPKQKQKETPTQAPAPADSPGGMGGLPISALTVGNFSITNGLALWIDHATNTRKEVKDISLILKDVSLDRPVQLKFSAEVDKNPLTLEGTVGPVGSGFEKGVVPLDLSLNALKQLAMKLKGNLENPATTPGVDIDITVEKFSPRELVAALGLAFPVETTDPEALSSLALKAHLNADANRASITNGVMNLDQSQLDFSATASQFSRPNLKFDLNLDKINLDRYRPPQSDQPPAGKSPAKGQGQKAKTDYTALRRLILDGIIKIGQLTISKANVQDVYLKIEAKNGVFNLDPMKLNMYQGNAEGKALFNVTEDIPQSSLNLKINNVQAKPLLKDMLAKEILQGSTNADINLSMRGDEPELIKKTLNGNGYLKFNDGAIIGIDLASMVRNVGSAFGLTEKSAERPKTDFTELDIPYTIKNGAVNTPQSSMKSPFIRIIAAGTADLVKETLDFRVEPKAVASIKGQGAEDDQGGGIMVPVVVSGTFSSPKFRPDVSAAAKQEIQKQIFKSKEGQPLEKSAKDALKGILGN
ncbi:MAG: AsmA family protein [Desulfobacteraceae bacterium]|jgi:AsmA protein|nr:AsmA family protein [Desulfobacteraceae bacterium]